MQIKIRKEPMVRAKINMLRFKYLYAKTFDIKNSLELTTTIISSNGVNKDCVIGLLHLGLDWGMILDFQTNKPDMNIKIHAVDCYDFFEYEPGYSDAQIFEFKEQKKSEKKFMVIQDYRSNPNFNILNFLAHNTYFYDKERWMPLIDMEMDGGK